IRRIGADGIITTLAGKGEFFGPAAGDRGPAAEAVLSTPTGMDVAPDGSLYVGDWGSSTVRRIHAAMPDYTSGNVTVPSSDGAQVFEFDRSGRELRARSALTGATLESFSYDFKGRLTGVVDGNGNRIQVERGPTGAPSALVAPYGQ